MIFFKENIVNVKQMPSPETLHSSLRKCDLYDNPYNTQMQAHPAIVKQRQETFAVQDSISSSQKKLEKELFESFKQFSMQMFSGKFFIIGQAGKYAFLAIMLPTYLFFYGIPKWLLTEAAPVVYDFTKRIVSHAGSKIGSAVSHLATAAFEIVRTVTDPILNFIQTRIEKSREFYHNVKQRIEQIVKSFSKTLISPFQKITQPIVGFYRKLTKSVQLIREKISDFAVLIEKVFEKIKRIPDRVAEALKIVQEKFKELKEKILQTCTPLLNLFKNLDHQVSKWFKKGLEFKDRWMNTLVYQPFKAVNETYQAIKDRTVALVRRVSDPLINWVKPKFEKAIEVVDSIKESVSSTIRNLSEKISETFKKYTEEVIKQILPQPVIAFFHSFVSTAGQVIKTPYRLFLYGKSSKRKIKRLKEKLRIKLVHLNQQLLSFLKKGYQKAKPRCAAFTKKAAKTLMGFFRLIKEMLKGAFYMIRMIFAWLKILFKQGMITVKETCAGLLPRL